MPKPTDTATPIAPFTPAITPTVDISATLTALAQADPIDRQCPDPPPGKPDYNHYYLDAEAWSTPNSALGTHYWLGKPLPGGGRLLYTKWLPYGYDAGGRYLLHNGIDVAEPEGTPILAVADGTVVVAGEDLSRLYGWRCNWYGQLVVIELDRRWLDKPIYVVYGHVLKINVKPGQHVSRGDPVAEVGFGGAAPLPHLHLEVRVGTNEFSSTRNPLLWLEPPATRGLIAGRLVDPDGRPWQGVAVAAVGRSEGTEDQTTWTYLDDPSHLINPDESWAENFVIGDLRPGEYELYVEIQGVIYRQSLIVEEGKITEAELITEPYKTPTPAPTENESDLPSPTPG